MKSLLHTLACLTLLTQFGFTAPVDEEQVTTFAAGEPAVAAEMNQTLQALITAINDNASRLDAIEAAETDPIISLHDKVSGSEYRLMALGVGVGNNGTRVTNNVRGSYDTFILNENGTFSGSINENRRESSIDVSVNVGSDPLSSHVTIPEGVNETLNEGVGGAWSLSGQILTLDGDNYFVSPDGGLLISGGQADESLSGGVTLTEVDLVIGVRILKPKIKVYRVDDPGPPILETEFTNNETNGVTVPRTYRITNDGATALKNLSVTGSAELVEDLGSTSLAPGASTTFRASGGATNPVPGQIRTIQINSNDEAANPFIINLQYP